MRRAGWIRHRPTLTNTIPLAGGFGRSRQTLVPGRGQALERLATGRDTELAEQALDVRAHGVLGDVEPGRDLIGAEMLVEQQEHLDLARRELLRDLVGDPAHPATFADAVEQAAGDRAGEGRLTVRDAAKKQGNALGRLALEEVAGGSCTDRLEQVLVRSRGGEHDDLALGRCLADVRQGAEPVHSRHRQVEQHEAGSEPSRLHNCLFPVRRMAYNVEAVLLQQGGESLPRQGMVVRDQDALHIPLIGRRPRAD